MTSIKEKPLWDPLYTLVSRCYRGVALICTLNSFAFFCQGALLLTEVLKEREAQLELKRLKEAALAGQDQDWLEKARREYEESILRDQNEAQKRMLRMKDTASFQKAQ